MRAALAFVGMLLGSVAACGDDGASSSGGGGNMTSSSSTTVSATASISTGAGGEDPGPLPCLLTDAVDHTGEPALTITSEGVRYEPRCVRVSAGTAVTFVSNFDTHPLRGGEVIDGQGVVDPTSPITPQSSGMTATFTLTEIGEVPFFCAFHASIGMFGTIWVE